MKKISILVIEDNRLLREGIATILKKQPDMHVVATVGNGENILVMTGKVKPNIILLDLRSEEHTSELQSLRHLVCRLLLEKNYTAARDVEHVPVAGDESSAAHAGAEAGCVFF